MNKKSICLMLLFSSIAWGSEPEYHPAYPNPEVITHHSCVAYVRVEDHNTSGPNPVILGRAHSTIESRLKKMGYSQVKFFTNRPDLPNEERPKRKENDIYIDFFSSSGYVLPVKFACVMSLNLDIGFDYISHVKFLKDYLPTAVKPGDKCFKYIVPMLDMLPRCILNR